MTKVISYSLWGDNPRYTKGAIANAELAAEIYPDWVCRFYAGTDVPADILDNLQNRSNTQIYFMTEEPNWNGMFWRFLAADSSDDIMLSRDTDSRITYREKAAVEEWLESERDFHIMRDHPYHKTEIMGGMWGVRNGLLKGLGKMMSEYEKGEWDNKWQVDQNFLRDVVYPKIICTAFQHGPFYMSKEYPWGRRHPAHFIGQAYNGDGFVLDDTAASFHQYIEYERAEYAKSNS